MLERAQEPFEFFCCIELRQMLGLKAETEKELAGMIQQVPLDSIYYHTCSLLIRHRYRAGAFSNDFATWLAVQVRDRVLGERLAVLDPLSFDTLDALRDEIVSVIDSHLKSIVVVPRVVYGEPFNFIQSRIVAVPAGMVAHTLEEFRQAVSEVDDRTIYYHTLEARVRRKHRQNDFSAWLRDHLGLPALAARIEALNPFTGGLEWMRTQLLASCDQVLTQGRDL